MDFDIIRGIAENFVLKNFANVRAVEITDMRPGFFSGGRPVYKVIGLAQIATTRMAPTLSARVPVEILIAQDGRVVSVQGRVWDDHQRGRKGSQLRRKR